MTDTRLHYLRVCLALSVVISLVQLVVYAIR